MPIDRQHPGHRRLPSTAVSLALLALFVSAFAAPYAGATTVLRLGDDELIDAAHLVVVGVCTASAPVRAGGRLLTRAELTVEAAWKGRSARTLNVILPGGVDRHAVPPIAEVWPGAPTLAVGERAVLFLRPAADAGVWTVVGFSQGKLELAARGDGGVTVGVSRGAPPLAAFAARVRARVEATGGEPGAVVDGDGEAAP